MDKDNVWSSFTRWSFLFRLLLLLLKLFTSSFNNIIDFPSIYGCCLEEGRVGCWLLVPSCFPRLFNRMFKSACKAWTISSWSYALRTNRNASLMKSFLLVCALWHSASTSLPTSVTKGRLSACADAHGVSWQRQIHLFLRETETLAGNWTAPPHAGFFFHRCTWMSLAAWTCLFPSPWWSGPSLCTPAPPAPPALAATAATAAHWAGLASRRDLKVCPPNTSVQYFLVVLLLGQAGLYMAPNRRNVTDAATLILHTTAPPSYSDLAISESQRRDCLQGCDSSYADDDNLGSLQTYITEFRYLPPPLYSEVQLTTHTQPHTHTTDDLTGTMWTR